MTFANINHWNIRDRFADRALADIPSAADRALSLLARSRTKPALQIGFVNIFGAIDMIAGLEYHASGFAKACAELAAGQTFDQNPVLHEAVAYINRAGQFHAFAGSDFVTAHIPSPLSLIPSVSRIMIFRNKHAAHRSIDAPRKEAQEEHWRHAQSLGSLGGHIFTPKPGRKFDLTLKAVSDSVGLQRGLWENNYLTINTWDGEAKAQINFTLEAEHPIILREAFGLVERIISWEAPAERL